MSRRETGARLAELSVDHDVIAAARLHRHNLELGAFDLSLRHIQCTGRLVERRSGRVTVGTELAGSVESVLRAGQRRLRLVSCLFCGRLRQFLHLAQARFGLGDDPFRLGNCRSQFAVIELNERLARFDSLPFHHRHTRHHRGDLAADVDPERRFHMTASDDRLEEQPAHGHLTDDLGSKYRSWTQIQGKT